MDADRAKAVALIVQHDVRVKHVRSLTHQMPVQRAERTLGTDLVS